MGHILITGLPGVGKTTLVREVAHRLSHAHPAGFYTEEIRVRGTRHGFRLVSLDGRRQILSRTDHGGPYRVGRYGVDVAGFERLLAELDLRHCPSHLIIIDEIGKMECLSQRFREEVEALLDSTRTVIATIALKGDGFIRRVKARPNCRLMTVTVGNRDHLAGDVATTVRDSLSPQQDQ